jgi:hypothetical protein
VRIDRRIGPYVEHISLVGNYVALFIFGQTVLPEKLDRRKQEILLLLSSLLFQSCGLPIYLLRASVALQAAKDCCSR